MIAWNQGGGEIVMLPAAQLRQGHRRINIIEGCYTAGSLGYPGPNGYPVGDIRPYHDDIGPLHRSAEALLEVVQTSVECGAAIRRCGQVTRFGIPRHITFKKEHMMTACHQSLYQS